MVTPEMFDVRRFAGNERIQFSERERFFKFLVDHTEDIHAGDVVAIHGYKRDDRVHQHAIFVERTDPITGFAYGLADQMYRPRRRTWEGIMAEAPKRSLLFRVHPKDEIFAAIDPGEPIAARTSEWSIDVSPHGREPIGSTCTVSARVPTARRRALRLRTVRPSSR